MSTLPAFTSLGDLKVETSTWRIMSRSPYEFESYIYIYRTHTQSVITTLVKPWWTHSMVNLHNINAPLGRGTARRARPTLGLYAQHLSPLSESKRGKVLQMTLFEFRHNMRDVSFCTSLASTSVLSLVYYLTVFTCFVSARH